VGAAVVLVLIIIAGTQGGGEEVAVEKTPTPGAATATPAGPTATPTPKPAKGLTREDAVPIGQSVTAQNKIELWVLEVIRDAWPQIYAMNSFNSKPDPGEEAILVKLGVRFHGQPNETKMVNPINLRVVSEKGVIYDSEWMDSLDPGIGQELFGGGETSGYVSLRVPSGEQRLVLIYSPPGGSVYLKLY